MKNILLFQLLWIFLSCFKLYCSISYCNFSKEHLLCGNTTFHSRCGATNKIIYNEVTEEEKTFYVEYHNNLRNEFATGKAGSENDTFFPTAANMEEIVWNEELANMADANVKRCSMEPTCDKCRQTMEFDNVGENLFIMLGTVEVNMSNDEASLELALWDWSNEKRFYFPSDISENTTEENALQHSAAKYKNFQKMIWWNTSLIGCAKIAFSRGNEESEVLFTCYYAPGGDYQREPLYKIGEPCTECYGEDRICSTKHPGLCSAETRSTNSNYDSTANNTSRVVLMSGRRADSEFFQDKLNETLNKIRKKIVTSVKKIDEKRRKYFSHTSSTRPWFNKMALFCFASWIVVFF